MTWDERGGFVISKLMVDLNLTKEQAAGIVGNLGFESEGFETLHERGQPEGKGGYGWAQWTADRRETFFAWCDERGLDWRSDDANYGYLIHELKTTQSHSLKQLKKTTTLEAAVFTFGVWFERPGGTTATFLPGNADRLRYARQALAGAAAYMVYDMRHLAKIATAHKNYIKAVEVLQKRLKEAGMYSDKIDGDFGPNTRAALNTYLKASR